MAGGGNAGLVQALQVRGCADGALMFGWRQRLHTALPPSAPAAGNHGCTAVAPAPCNICLLRYTRLSRNHVYAMPAASPRRHYPAAPSHPLQRGLANMLGQSSGFIESLPVPVRS